MCVSVCVSLGSLSLSLICSPFMPRRVLEALFHNIRKVDSTELGALLAAASRKKGCEGTVLNALLEAEFKKFIAVENMNAILRGASLTTKFIDAYIRCVFFLLFLSFDFAADLCMHPSFQRDRAHTA